MNNKIKKKLSHILHISAEYVGMSSTLTSTGSGKPASFISKR